ncbi:MAG: molybdenum cofactor biosynthesis protein MoaE [Pseudomonadota bacterium]|mgnify:FL=1
MSDSEIMAISATPINTAALRASLADVRAGAIVTFEGWVRNLNEGRDVEALEYEVYAPLAVTEGERIITEVQRDIPIIAARAVHRSGALALGDCAVWVGVVSPHRDEAFRACRRIIDEIKVRLPIWKKENYSDGDSGWVNCERCAAHAHG